MPIEAAPAAALWSALNIVLLLVLSILVVRQRQKHKVTQGHGGEPGLEGAMRAFGNASEYIPAGIGALAVMAIAGVSPLLVHAAGATLFLGRVVHAFGLSGSPGLTRGRVIGMLLTWVAYVFSAAVLVLYAVG
jgi:uncharacterized protein